MGETKSENRTINFWSGENVSSREHINNFKNRTIMSKKANKKTSVKNEVKNGQLICCICGKPILDDPYGHNPYPVKSTGRCCTKCNERVVLPTRIINEFKHRNIIIDVSRVSI